MRPLTVDELDLVAGGLSHSSSTYSSGTITVTGHRSSSSTITVTGDPGGWTSSSWGWSSSTSSSSWYGGGGGGGGDSDSSSTTETVAGHTVTTNIDRPLTPQEQAAVDEYKQSIAEADKTIDAIPDNALVQLNDGSIITGAELKEAWNNTSFVINDSVANGGPTYENNSGRGEADWNNGVNPTVSQNIDNIVNYQNAGEGGLEYLVLHEIAHLVDDNRDLYSSLANDADGYTTADANRVETQANDIARAIANTGGMDILGSPNPSGYTDPNYTFSTPPTGGTSTGDTSTGDTSTGGTSTGGTSTGGTSTGGTSGTGGDGGGTWGGTGNWRYGTEIP